MSLGSVRSIPVAFLGIGLVAALVGQAPAAAAIAGPAAGSHPYLVSLRGFEARSSTPAAARPDAARVARVDHAVDALSTRLGFRPTFQYHWALQGFAADLDAAQVAALRADPRVGAISPDEPVQLTDQTIPSGVQRIRARPTAAGGPALPDLGSVNVAEIDTGIRHLGTERELNVAGGIDCADDAMHGQTSFAAWKDADPAGHGSHVAGIIGARDNGSAVVGVAPGVKLWSVRVFDSQLQGSSSTVVCGLDWVALSRMGPPGDAIDVANLSLRGPREPGGPEACMADPRDDPDVEHVAVCGAFNAGVTLVVAAGNESTDARDVVPAAYDQVITVSALSDFDGRPGGLSAETCPGSNGREKDDTFARYSNFGADVDLIAPGSCIVSINLGAAGAGTRVMSGSSMAAPHVAGAAARYIAAVYGATGTRPSPAQVRSALRATAGFNWNAATDPDAVPDRLLNVAGLSAAPGFVLSALPSHMSVAAGSGSAERTLQLELTRLGLFRKAVHISASGPPGIVVVVAATSLAGLGDAGISTTARVNVAATVADGDYAVKISASSPAQPDRHVTVAVHVDRHAPVVANLAAAIVPGTSLRASVAVHLSWLGTDRGGAIADFELQRQVAAGPWQAVNLARPTSQAADRLMPLKTDCGFRVRATDDSGNSGAWTAISLRMGLRESDQPAILFSSSGWTQVSRASASGGSLRTSHTAGAFASVTFFGTGVAWVAPVGPGKGRASVLLDGVDPGRAVSLRASTSGKKRIVYASPAMAEGIHTLTIRVKSGTVDLDAILILG